jgi:hypothetical protein
MKSTFNPPLVTWPTILRSTYIRVYEYLAGHTK